MEIGRYANLVAVGATRRMLASPTTPALPRTCDSRTDVNKLSFQGSGFAVSGLYLLRYAPAIA